MQKYLMLNMLLKDTICIEVMVQTNMVGVILYIRDNTVCTVVTIRYTAD